MTIISCTLLRQQASEAVENFPKLRENLGYQLISDSKTCELDPVAKEDARSDFYQTWAAYETAAGNEWCAAQPAICELRGAAERYSLINTAVVQVASNSIQHIYHDAQMRFQEVLAATHNTPVLGDALGAGYVVAGLGWDIFVGIPQGIWHYCTESIPTLAVDVFDADVSNEQLAQEAIQPLFDVLAARAGVQAVRTGFGVAAAGYGQFIGTVKGAADALKNNFPNTPAAVMVSGGVQAATQSASAAAATGISTSLPLFFRTHDPQSPGDWEDDPLYGPYSTHNFVQLQKFNDFISKTENMSSAEAIQVAPKIIDRYFSAMARLLDYLPEHIAKGKCKIDFVFQEGKLITIMSEGTVEGEIIFKIKKRKGVWQFKPGSYYIAE